MLQGFIKNNKKAIYLLAFYFCLILVISYYWPQEVDWRPSYSAQHSKPYGAKVLRSELAYLFPDSEIMDSERPIFNTVHDTLEFDEKTAYVFLNKNFYTDSLELSRLYSFVSKGNTVFIAAEGYSENLLDTLNLDVVEDFMYPSEKDSVKYAFTARPFSKKEFEFPKAQFLYTFEADSLFNGNVVSYVNYDIQFNQVIVPFGKGRFILNSNPLGFTNYNILKEGKSTYAANCLSYLGAHSKIIWDSYYKIGKPGRSKTPLAEILKIPGLRWAYWISLFTILLFMGFHSKRRQRIIPVEEELKNSSVEYVETMGNLYYNQASIKSIVLKKIEYFKSYLYRNYNMSNINFSEEDQKRLLAKTGKPKDEVAELFTLIEQVLQGEEVNVASLKTLTEKINKFYK